jgi:hypothetical protein
LSLKGVTFESERIDALPRQEVDLAISLHACDTATDQALCWAVGSNAQVILAAPCCQRELFSKIESPALDDVLHHGILKERMAALVTDALRVCALKSAGYRTQILEFIELEHTPKNLLIRAVRRSKPTDKPGSRMEYDRLKKFFALNGIATDAILTAHDANRFVEP